MRQTAAQRNAPTKSERADAYPTPQLQGCSTFQAKPALELTLKV